MNWEKLRKFSKSKMKECRIPDASVEGCCAYGWDPGCLALPLPLPFLLEEPSPLEEPPELEPPLELGVPPELEDSPELTNPPELEPPVEEPPEFEPPELEPPEFEPPELEPPEFEPPEFEPPVEEPSVDVARTPELEAASADGRPVRPSKRRICEASADCAVDLIWINC